MAFYVYILKCSDGSYYTGHTDDLERRLAAHQQGVIAGYTSVRRPLRLVFSESFATREEALQRERQIKGLDSAEERGSHAAGLGPSAPVVRSPWLPLMWFDRLPMSGSAVITQPRPAEG